MDVVYLIKEPMPGEPDSEELKYSIRSLKNMPHDKVVIVGYCPSYIDKSEVLHIPAPQTSDKYRNTTNLLLKALRDKRVSIKFILMNDDFFILKPICKVEDELNLHAGNLVDRCYGQYKIGQEPAETVLRRLGIPNANSYALHMPFVINRHRFIQIIEKYALLAFEAFYCNRRSFYGNLNNVGGEKTRDCKIFSTKQGISDLWKFASTSDENFTSGDAGKVIRNMFPDVSQYENYPGKPIKEIQDDITMEQSEADNQSGTESGRNTGNEGSTGNGNGSPERGVDRGVEQTTSKELDPAAHNGGPDRRELGDARRDGPSDPNAIW